jgi:hypothetical protein
MCSVMQSPVRAFGKERNGGIKKDGTRLAQQESRGTSMAKGGGDRERALHPLLSAPRRLNMEKPSFYA